MIPFAIGAVLGLGDLNPLLEAQADSGSKLLGAIHSEKTNACVSPFSLQSAATLLRTGAVGETDRELAKILEHGSASSADLAMAIGKSRVFADNLTKAGVLVSANAIWSVDPLRAAFEKSAKERFRATTVRTKFPEPGLGLINRWVSEQTRGRIPKMLDELDPATEVVIGNAVWFKDTWISPFDPANTTDFDFTLKGGTKVPVKAMRASKMRFSSGAIDGARLFRLPMNHSSLLIYVPEVGCELALRSEGWNKALRDEVTMLPKNGPVILPKIEFATDVDLLKVWTSMGMKLANSARGDFSKMSDQKTYLSKAIQKSFIKWDEEGAEGTVATILGNTRGVPPPSEELKVDRPFLFAIFSGEMIVFMGYVEDPRK